MSTPRLEPVSLPLSSKPNGFNEAHWLQAIHELKSPLTALQIHLELLQKAIHEYENLPSVFQERVQSMAFLLDRMRFLTCDFLNFEKYSTLSSESLQVQKFQFNSLFKKAIEQFEPLLCQKRIRLAIETCPENLVIHANEEGLFQVFSNLLSNSIKFTPQGGIIHIEVSVIDQSLCFNLKDSGVGISPDQVDKIFDPFWGVKSNNPLGSGLGLAITRKIIENHGGKIWAESKPMQGMQISFIIPNSVNK